MKSFDPEDPFMERYDVALSRGKGKATEILRPCAVCGRTMRTGIPFITAAVSPCRVVDDELDILGGESWFALCEACAARFDVSSLQPVERPGGRWSTRSDRGRESTDNVIPLFDEDEEDVLYYYFECARCGNLIVEKEIFTRFHVSRIVHIHLYLIEELETVASVEFCADCTERFDFKKVVLWRRDKSVAELFSFGDVYGLRGEKRKLRAVLP